MKHCIKFILPGMLTLLVCTTSVVAQTYVYPKGKKPAADEIIAIVGSKIVLKSDLQKTLVQEMQKYDSLPPNASCAILEQMLAQNVLVLQAEKDSLPVSDDRVEANLTRRINYFERMYGSREKMEEVLGMSIYQIKDKFRKPIKEQMLAQAMRDKIMNEVKITPTEVRAFFNAIPKDSLPYFKSEVEVGQIVIKPDPDPTVVDYTINQLEELKKEAESGKKSFTALANLYSNDVATGGKILTIDRTQRKFDPKFVAAAYRLKDGEISPVFKSQFGYHIIQMVSRQGNIAKVRHILLIPPVTSGDVNKAVKKLDSVRKKIISEKLTFGQAASLYSDDDEYGGTKNKGGMFTMPDGSTFMTMDAMDPSVVLALDTMDIGEVSAPIVFIPNQRRRDQKAVRIIYLKSRSKPHRESLKTDYSRIQDQALRKKQYEVLDKWFDKHVSNFYLQIDEAYKDCKNIQSWIKASDKIKKETDR